MKGYAIAYNNRKNGLVGQPFKTRKEAEEVLPIYEKKGWTGGIVRVEMPKPMSEEEKKEWETTSCFLKLLNKEMKGYV